MKKLILLILMITIFSCSKALCAENYLNAVVLEGIQGGYNVVLRSDAIASVKRTVSDANKIVLDIKGLTASEDISTIYKNTSSANGIIVENKGNNEVIIQIQGKNISKANIILDSPATAPIVVPDGFSKKTAGWAALAFLGLCVIFAKSRKLKVDSQDKIQAAVQKKIRDREIALYKNYRKDLLTKPSIDYKVKNPRIQQAIRRADTIRHLQRTTKV